ncbi:hairy and enhancer of split related-7 [Cyprinodon tularosa]|uniref:hairy and enhancer of split related-7 n=1 Tax=Cyprinodon tularosa TaxID=77115 RepID=UPI0018E25233|nr:hairy and enhancer of split related-7 [Cyprinodon tularosa]
MKLQQETDDAASKRKLIKSQLEKRRRERMNRSLERLRTMLLQEPQQGGTQHRAEKAEILEHTVLFLQRNAREHKEKNGGQKYSFQDGFSSCLQRASHFLGPEGKGLWLGPVLDATFSSRFPLSDSPSADTWVRTSVSMTHTKSLLQMLRLRSRSNQPTQASGASSSAHHHTFSDQQSFLGFPQQPQSGGGLEMGADRPGGKEGSSQSGTLSQTLWRPWP